MRSGFVSQKVPASRVDFSSGTPKVLDTEVLVEVDEVEDALNRETALAVEDEAPIAPDFVKDTQTIATWLRGGAVPTHRLNAELALWLRHFGGSV